MRLVCFLGFTAGGLVCDLLNNVESYINDDGTVLSNHHDLFKGLTPYLDKGPFDENKWLQTKQILRSKNKLSRYYGTHTHPANIPEIYRNEFEEILVISTITETCKFYKYMRFRHLYTKSPDLETCFSDYAPIENCTEIRFRDIIEGKFVKDYNLNVDHFEHWKKFNSYLYRDPTIEEVESFHELYYQYRLQFQ